MRGVRGPQVGVGLVEGVPQAVVLQRHRLVVEVGGQGARGVGAGAAGGVHGVLVEVVAEVEDEVHVLAGQVPVRGVVPLVVPLAGDEAEGEVGGPAGAGGRGAGASGRADVPAGAEAVVVDVSGCEVTDLDVHGVLELGVGGGPASSDDAAEPFVQGHLPVHLHALGGQSAVGLVRERGQARPQQYGVGLGVARGDAEREGVGGQPRGVQLGGARGPGGRQVHGEGERGGGAGDGQEAAAAQVPGGGAEFGRVHGPGRVLVVRGCHPFLPLRWLQGAFEAAGTTPAWRGHGDRMSDG